MKERSQKMIDLLHCINEDILSDALDIDDAKKLKEYSQKRRAPVFINRGFYKIAIAVACLTLALVTVCSSFVLLGIFSDDNETQGYTEKDQDIDETLSQGNATNDKIIDSIDEVNYYSAMVLLNDSYFDRAETSSTLTLQKRPLITKRAEETDENDMLPTKPDKPVVEVYDLSACCYRITTVLNFEIEITENDPFLYGKFGMGRAEVIVTDLSYEGTPATIITFKSGNNYFSCLADCEYNTNEENFFWTHKYISGFFKFNDMRETPTCFSVKVDEENNVSIYWCPEYRSDDSIIMYPIHVYEDTVRLTDDADYNFTIEFFCTEYGFDIADIKKPVAEDDSYVLKFTGIVSYPDDRPSAESSPPIILDPDAEVTLSDIVTINSGKTMITPPVFYVQKTTRYEDDGRVTVENNSGAYDHLVKTEEGIPEIKLEEKLRIEGGGFGVIRRVEVYSQIDGEYEKKENFGGTTEDLLSLDEGRWFVILAYYWDDLYMYGEAKYESYVLEYIFVLEV